MAIAGQQTINIGAQNQQAGSDSLYDAFNKVQNNFTQLFSLSSPYNTYTSGVGISAYGNSTSGVLTITNTGVLNLAAGTGITLSATSGNITISASGNGNLGVTSVGLSSANSTLSITNTPIVSAGNINVDLPLMVSGNYAAGEYIAPTMTVDNYGRVTAIANGVSVGTVTSVGIQAVGSGLLVSNSPVTSSGIIEITNTGVTRLNAGTGIDLSGTTGEITISSINLNQGTVTLIDITSTTLTVTGGPVTTTGNITVDIPSTFSVSGTITADTLVANTTVDTLDLTSTGEITANVITTDTITANTVTLDGDDTTITFMNTSGNTVSFVTPSSIADSSYYVPDAGGTVHQVLGITASGTPQTLGWKTIPVQYVTVNLRPSGSFEAPFYPVLRSFPLNTRTGILNLNLS